MIYQKKIKYMHLSIIKGMLKQINHELISINKNKLIDKKNIMKTYYSIKKII
jgi:hypothetical protein